MPPAGDNLVAAVSQHHHEGAGGDDLDGRRSKGTRQQAAETLPLDPVVRRSEALRFSLLGSERLDGSRTGEDLVCQGGDLRLQLLNARLVALLTAAGARDEERDPRQGQERDDRELP